MGQASKGSGDPNKSLNQSKNLPVANRLESSDKISDIRATGRWSLLLKALAVWASIGSRKKERPVQVRPESWIAGPGDMGKMHSIGETKNLHSSPHPSTRHHIEKVGVRSKHIAKSTTREARAFGLHIRALALLHQLHRQAMR